MNRVRQIGRGLAMTLLIAALVLGCVGFAAAAAAAADEPPQYASALQKIFRNLAAESVSMAFGGPIAAPLGIATNGQTVAVEEMPPVRMNADVVYVFDRLKDGSGAIVLRFMASGFVALRFDKSFNFVAGAIQLYGQPVAALSGAAAEKIVSDELRDCETIASRLTARR